MQLKYLPYVLIFVILLRTCVEAELVNNHQWKDILPYLNTKYFQQSRPSLFATANNTLCSQHFQIYLDQINVSYWAMQMFDSSTKFPESVLMGQSVFLGNFDECIGVENVQTERGPFSGQHCLVAFQGGTASLRTHDPQDSQDIDIGSLRGNIRDMTSSDRMIVFTGSDSVLSLSFCIPSTCSAQDFEDMFNSYLQSMNLSVVATTNEMYCQTNEGKRLGTEDWVAVVVFAFVILLVVTSTAYDLIVKETKKELLTAFSVYSNGKKLLSTKTSGDTLHAIHGMRFITICWVVWGHRYTVDAAVPSINLSTAFDLTKDAGRLYLTNGTLSVDTFLVLSGLLVSYVFLKQMKHESSCFNIPLYYLHRYVRLTPPYAAVILFEATLYRYVANGPLLPAVTYEMAQNCQKYWWTSILYINNYVGVDQRCVEQSWYLSVDMQLFVLSPAVLFPLWKWPRQWNILLLAGLTVAGIISPFTISYVTKLSANLLYGNEGRVLEEEELYIATYSRFGPWVIGVAFGYFIYEAKRTELKLSVIQIAAGWIFSNVALLGSLNGVYSFYQDDADKTILESAFYNGLFRNVWAFGVGVTIFMCVTGYGGAANMLLSWKVFPTLSRLSYCIYLTHLSYQIVQSYSARTAIYFADLTEWPAFFSDVIISLILAAILSLCIEAPTLKLEKCLLRTDRRNRENNTEETPPEPRENYDNVHINESMEHSNASEDENRNFTEIRLEETNVDTMEQYLIRE